MPTQSNQHKNDEPTVECPACGKEVLSRGLHLHVMRSSGDGHGPHMEVPDDLDLESAKRVGQREVEMQYPESRETEQVARLCPYCRRPFTGKNGVMIHLGQMSGRKNHPDNPKDKHDPEDFPVVHVDDNENVVEVVEEGTVMPSTRRRLEDDDGLTEANVRRYIESLREQGMEEQADKAQRMLLGE